MPLIDDLANESTPPDRDPQHTESPEQISGPKGMGIVFPSWVTAKTGPGSVEDYLDHTLNFNHSHWMAKICRGITGIFGELNIAIVDIGLGILERGMEAKRVNVNAGSKETNHLI